MPRHGIFVEERLKHLVMTRQVQASVVALRPRFPRRSNSHRTETRAGIAVDYVSVPTVRKLSNWVDPWLWASAAQESVRKAIARNIEQPILDAHFLYPDCVAAVIIGQRFGIPVVMSARGSDVNVKCTNLVMRHWVRWAAARSAAVITVSQALARKMKNLAIASPVLEVIPNGVDLEKFQPRNREESQRRLGVRGKVIATVGHLLDDKGHHLAVEALARLPEACLLIVGDGPRKTHLEKLAVTYGVADRVRIIGHLPHDEMPYLYSAADMLVLASVREGMPNVILESLACGTRVIATDTGGIREIVQSIDAGVLITDRSAKGLLEGIARFESTPIPVEATREYAARFGWSEMIRKQIQLYGHVLDRFGH